MGDSIVLSANNTANFYASTVHLTGLRRLQDSDGKSRAHDARRRVDTRRGSRQSGIHRLTLGQGAGT